MKIIQEYKRVTEDIAVIKSKIKTVKRELDKNINRYKPSDIKAINYDKEKVQTSMYQESILVVANNIFNLQQTMKEFEQELQELMEQRGELEDIINTLNNLEQKVCVMRIQGHSIKKIAWKLNYSEIYIKKISQRIKEYTQSIPKKC